MNRVLSIISVLIAFTCTLHAADPPRNIFTGSGSNAHLSDPRTRILLARVTEVSAPVGAPPPTPISYRAKVICEYRGRIPEGSVVSIEGLIHQHDMHAKEIPVYAVGATFIMVVKAKEAEGHFEYAGDVEGLPIGLPAPMTVAAEDAADLREGLRKLGEILSDQEGVLKRAVAESLLRQNNYFLWALGIAGLAVHGTFDDANLLRLAYQDEKASARQVLWIDYSMAFILPESTRPPILYPPEVSPTPPACDLPSREPRPHCPKTCEQTDLFRLKNSTVGRQDLSND